jgi:hypothetical protein
MNVDVKEAALAEYSELEKLVTLIGIPSRVFNEHGEAALRIRTYSNDPSHTELLGLAQESLKSLCRSAPTTPRKAIEYLSLASTMTGAIVVALEKENPSGSEEIHFENLMELKVLRGMIVGTLGSLGLSLKEIRLASVKKASKGRKLIGAASRSKVKKAAEFYRHLSKEKAAPEIAKIVSLDSGTVRRYLSELFPRDAWKK